MSTYLVDDFCDRWPSFSSDESTSIDGFCSPIMGSPSHWESDHRDEWAISQTPIQIGVHEVVLTLSTTSRQNVIRLSNDSIIQRKIRSKTMKNS